MISNAPRPAPRHASPDDILPTYEAKAEAFDRLRNRALFERAWLGRWLGVAPHPGPRVRVLDLGCGTGRPIATYLAERGAEITGVDGAPRMLELFRRHVPSARAVEADMRGLALGERFDAILAWDSFFHLSGEDQRAMFPVFAAHAGPRAALLFTTGPNASTVTGDLDGHPLFHESLDPAEYEALLAAAGFRLVDVRLEDPDCDRHSVWLARAAG